jgi:hypothetical protein
MSTDMLIQNLRAGKFFQEWAWLNYLEQRYASTTAELNMDALIPIATYELITHGFQKEDEKSIQMLYAMVNDTLVGTIPGKYLFPMITLLSAALQCMVYLDNDLFGFYQNKAMDESVLAWMQRDNKTLTCEQNNEALAAKRAWLETKLVDCQKEIRSIRQEVSSVRLRQDWCLEYEAYLMSESQKDLPKETKLYHRLGLVKSLCEYVRSEAVVTDEFKKNVDSYVQTLRKMDPEPWEEERFLSRLSPKSYMQIFRENTLQFFVNSLIPETPKEGAPSSQQEGPTSPQ